MSSVNTALITTLGRGVLSRSRVLGFVGVAVIQLLVSMLVRNNLSPGDNGAVMTLIDGFGLTLIIPLSALVFGTSSLGDPIEDGTFVYLWLRPIARWRITMAAYVVTLAAVVALGAVPTVLSAVIASGERDVILGAAGGALAAAVAYSAVFVLIGQLTRRSLVWGIAYLLIFEQFVSRGGRGVGSLAVHSYAVSIVEAVSGVELKLGYFTGTTAAIAIAFITLVGLGISIARQSAMTVD